MGVRVSAAYREALYDYVADQAVALRNLEARIDSRRGKGKSSRAPGTTDSTKLDRILKELMNWRNANPQASETNIDKKFQQLLDKHYKL